MGVPSSPRQWGTLSSRLPAHLAVILYQFRLACLSTLGTGDCLPRGGLRASQGCGMGLQPGAFDGETLGEDGDVRGRAPSSQAAVGAWVPGRRLRGG